MHIVTSIEIQEAMLEEIGDLRKSIKARIKSRSKLMTAMRALSEQNEQLKKAFKR